jgi:ABC-2 type transport system permease protein
MSRLWIVARWEFTTTVLRLGFLATALMLPLAHMGLALLLGHSLRVAVAGGRGEKPIAIVEVRDEQTAMAMLREDRVEAVFVLEADYLETGRLRAYSQTRTGLFAFREDEIRRERADTLLRRRLLSPHVPASLAARVEAPTAHLQRFTIDRGGEVRPQQGRPPGVLTGAFGLSLLLSLSIFMSSGLLQQAMVAERQNRMLEVLLICVEPLPLLAGKVIGLAGAGLIQVGVYLGFLAAGAPLALAMIDVPAATVAATAACFLVGYVLYACVMAGTGALGRGTQESVQIATVWMLVGALPLFFIAPMTSDGTSALARLFTWFPLTAPTALLLRIGTGSVSHVELTAALALTLAAAGAALAMSARLLRRVTIAGAR